MVQIKLLYKHDKKQRRLRSRTGERKLLLVEEKHAQSCLHTFKEVLEIPLAQFSKFGRMCMLCESGFF